KHVPKPTEVLQDWLKLQHTETDNLREECYTAQKKFEALRRQVKLKEKKKEAVFKPGERAWKKLNDAYRRKIMARDQARRDKEMEKGPKTGEAYRVNVWIEGAADTDVEIGLKLTYLVRNASWEPRYDASLDTS